INLPTGSPSGVFTIQWAPAETMGPSGLFAYKIREFVDGNPVPREILQVATPTFTFGANQGSGSGALSLHALNAGVIAPPNTSSPLQLLNGETGAARAPGHFYRYQIQTINGAGTASTWSDASSNVN